MFCDVVDVTAFSEQLDPEDFHDIIAMYQETCTAIIRRFSGYIARQVGDAVLAYFGYPVAQVDAPQHAIRTGLALIAALPNLNARLQNSLMLRLTSPLQVRVGIHTGVAVIGEMGNKDYTESMALGETPNIAARLLSLANANTLVVSASTYHLTQEQFEYKNLALHSLKGIDTPVQVYQVITARES